MVLVAASPAAAAVRVAVVVAVAVAVGRAVLVLVAPHSIIIVLHPLFTPPLSRSPHCLSVSRF